MENELKKFTMKKGNKRYWNSWITSSKAMELSWLILDVGMYLYLYIGFAYILQYLMDGLPREISSEGRQDIIINSLCMMAIYILVNHLLVRFRIQKTVLIVFEILLAIPFFIFVLTSLNAETYILMLEGLICL